MTAALCLALLVSLAGCPSGEIEVPAGPLRIATGSPGGVYYLYGGAIAATVRERLPDLDPGVLQTAASAENLRLVDEGNAEVGFAQADTSADYAEAGKVVALVRLYDDYLHLVVRTDSGITSLAGLRGRRVSIGAKESGTIGTTRRLLGIERIDPARDIQPFELGLDDSAAALQANTIDAFFFSGGLPVGRVAALAERGGIAMVPIGQYATDLWARFGQYYTEHTVPASTYGLQTVTTLGIPNYLVVSKTMPEQTAYELTRLLFDEQAALQRAHPAAARLNSRSAIYTHPLALHRGAQRYFRETKP